MNDLVVVAADWKGAAAAKLRANCRIRELILAMRRTASVRAARARFLSRVLGRCSLSSQSCQIASAQNVEKKRRAVAVHLQGIEVHRAQARDTQNLSAAVKGLTINRIDEDGRSPVIVKNSSLEGVAQGAGGDRKLRHRRCIAPGARAPYKFTLHMLLP